MKQNFDYYYDEGFEDEAESLNPDGELFQVVFAQDGRVTSVSDSKHSLENAVQHAEMVISLGIQVDESIFCKSFFLRKGTARPLDVTSLIAVSGQLHGTGSKLWAGVCIHLLALI